MIEFDCPHCGNHFRVAVSLAGRHGWCRICKGFIVVPTARSHLRWEELPAEQRIVRLEKILRSTTELYNAQHEQLLALQNTLSKHVEAIEQARAIEQHVETIGPRLEQAERDIARLSHELALAGQARGTALAEAEQAARERDAASAALAESEAARAALASDLARAETKLAALEDSDAQRDALEAERDMLQRHLAEREADLERLHGDLTEKSGGGGAQPVEARQLLNQITEARAARDTALAERSRLDVEVRQLERSLAAVSADASRWQSEAERLTKSERQYADIQAKWDEAQALIRELHPGIAAAHEARGRAESEAAEAKARLARLEEQVSRLTEDNEAQRETIAALRRDAEQLRASAKVAEDEAEAARETVRRHELELARLRDNALQAAQLAPVTAERDEFRDRLVEAEAQVMRLKEELATAASDAVTGDGGPASRERETLRTELARTQQAKADAERHGHDLATELRQVAARLEQVTAERNRLVEEVTSLQEKGARFDALVNDLTNAQARLEESQWQVERLTERLAAMAGQTPYGRGGAAGRSRGYDAPVIRDDDTRDIALIPEVIDEDDLARSQELMASMLRFIEPRDRGE